MRRLRTLFAIAMMTVMIPAAAYAQLPRSANGGGAAAGTGPAPVAVPRHPYAGGWDGAITIDGAGAPAKIAMTFTVADASKQSYGGETTIAGSAATTHTNISAAAAAVPDDKAGTTVLPRRSGDAPPLANGPAAPAGGPAAPAGGEVDTLGVADHVILLYHTPSKSMLICGDDHRCVALATLTWEETGADGRHYAYSAQLTAADTMAGTVTVTGGPGKTMTGTFTLARRK